ncbi:MAG: transporter substrate-binding domain-containing protein [Desulfobacteraceae bacterium]|nr:transporter substrate-binding domain-containing protein [Desulfobacteraceae bacterium]
MKRKYIIPVAAMVLFAGALVICRAINVGGGSVPQGLENPLVVAMELQYPPFEMTDPSGAPSGISVEIAKGLADYLHRPLKIENTAWTGLIPSLQTGKADLVISSMGITEERRKVVDFSIPYGQSGLALLIHKSSKVSAFEDLNHPSVSVAVRSGTIGATIAGEKLPRAKVMYFEDLAACVLEVAQGKADAFIYDSVTVYQNYRKHPATTRINVTPVPGTGSNWGMAIKKGNRELAEQVNAYIAFSLKEKSFDAIAREYLGGMVSFFEKNNIPFYFDVGEK